MEEYQEGSSLFGKKCDFLKNVALGLGGWNQLQDAFTCSARVGFWPIPVTAGNIQGKHTVN